MSKSRLASACVLVCLVVALAGCAGSDHGPAESTCATLGENDRRRVAYASWSPAENIPAADLETVNETLGSYRQRMLFPAKFSVAGTGLASAEFHVYWTPPTDVAEVFLIFGTEDGAVDVTLISCTEYSSVVGWGLESIPGAVEVTVRGLPGRSYPRTEESRPMLYWQEQGQHFIASYRGWAVEPDTQQMIDWLESWYMLP